MCVCVNVFIVCKCVCACVLLADSLVGFDSLSSVYVMRAVCIQACACVCVCMRYVLVSVYIESMCMVSNCVVLKLRYSRIAT